MKINSICNWLILSAVWWKTSRFSHDLVFCWPFSFSNFLLIDIFYSFFLTKTSFFVFDFDKRWISIVFEQCCCEFFWMFWRVLSLIVLIHVVILFQTNLIFFRSLRRIKIFSSCLIFWNWMLIVSWITILFNCFEYCWHNVANIISKIDSFFLFDYQSANDMLWKTKVLRSTTISTFFNN